MIDSSRLEDLRRRVEKDPASIAFAQLAEEYRRVRRYSDAVKTCRAGLEIHPGYLSARVTLGRALIELGRLDEAEQELSLVLKKAPENLAAIRGLGEIFHMRGAIPEALEHYRMAWALAPHDPDLEQMVGDLASRLAPPAELEPNDSPARVPIESPSEPSRAVRIVAALELWLNAVYAVRTEQRS